MEIDKYIKYGRKYSVLFERHGQNYPFIRVNGGGVLHTIPNWVDKTLHDWAGGLLGGLGLIGLGPGGLIVGYICGAYIASTAASMPNNHQNYKLPNLIPGNNSQNQIGVDHNLMLNATIVSGHVQSDFDYILQTLKTHGYEPTREMDCVWLNKLVKEANALNAGDENQLFSICNKFTEANCRSIMTNTISQICKATMINQVNSIVSVAESNTNDLANSDQKTILLQALAVLRYSSNYWYLNLVG
jgi:hypothetical protein